MKFVTVADLHDYRFETGFGTGTALAAPPPDAQAPAAQVPLESTPSA
ncbi:MAG: hypothetical protein BWY92_00078 [Firmicutes bacterium ADurb.BinA052]|jgi:hypothetical protein|nr:MAG: hypothetical protein BWY92_00078 [Firmicutes bacterium ADurb.BinA052]